MRVPAAPLPKGETETSWGASSIKAHWSLLLSRRAATFYVLAAGILLVLLLYRLFFGGIIGGIIALRADLRTSERLYEIKLANLDGYTENLELYNKLESGSKSIVLPYNQLARAALDVSRMMAANNIDESEFSTGAMGDIGSDALGVGERLIQIRAFIAGTGEYDDIMRFLTDVAESEIYYSIDRIELSFDNADGGISLRLNFSIYCLKGQR